MCRLARLGALSVLGECGGNHRLDRSPEGVVMRGTVMGWDCDPVYNPLLTIDGRSYSIRVGKIRGTERRVFSADVGGVRVLYGSGYRSEAEIVQLVIDVIERREPVGNVSIDPANGVMVRVTRGVRV